MIFFMKKGILFLIMLMWSWTCSASIWSEMPGHSDWQELPFAKIRLVSCLTSPQIGLNYLAVHAQPFPGWELKTPDLATTTSNHSPGTVLIPFRQVYDDQMFFPITYAIQDIKQPITFTVSGSWSACHEETCITQPIRLKLDLPRETAIITPACTGITQTLVNTPIPTYMNRLSAQATRQQDNTILLHLDLPHLPHQLTAFDYNKQLLSVKAEVKGTHTKLVLPASTTNDDVLKLYIHSGMYYYEIETPVLKEITEPTPLSQIPFQQILFSSILMFLVSPWFLYFGRTKRTSFDQYKLQTSGAIIASSLFAIITLAWGIFQGDLSWFITPNMSIATWLIWAGVIFFLADALPITALLAAFITPRPYLHFLTNADLAVQLATLIIGFAVTIGTFVVQKIYAQKFFDLINRTNNLSLIWWNVRLPWLILIVWLYLYL